MSRKSEKPTGKEQLHNEISTYSIDIRRNRLKLTTSRLCRCKLELLNAAGVSIVKKSWEDERKKDFIIETISLNPGNYYVSLKIDNRYITERITL